MSQQHIVDENEMYEAQYTSRYSANFKKWYTCPICSLDFSEDEVILDGGVGYCTVYDHHLLIGKQRTGGKI